MVGENVEIILGSLGILGLGAVTIKENVAKNHPAGALDGVSQYGIVVTGAFNSADLIERFFRSTWPQFLFKLLQGFDGGVFLWGGEIHVERDGLGAASAQLIEHSRICVARDGPGADTLQGLLVDVHNDDAIIMGTSATHAEAGIQGTLFDSV